MVDSKKSYKAWFYLLPVIILMLLFTFYPLVNTFRIAMLKNYNYMDSSVKTYFSLFNFKKALIGIRSTQWSKIWLNTFFIVFVTVPISTLLALLIAVGLNSIKKLQKIFQTIFFLPYVTNTIAIGMVFAFMFHSDHGLINMIFKSHTNWIQQGSSWGKNMFVLCTYIIWNALPFKILILLSGLQSIDKQYYEAAKIDATPKKRVFWRITVPLLSPMIAYVLITSFIGAFKEYSSIVSIFGESAGPVGAPGQVGTVVWFMYDFIRQPAKIGYAAAAGVILFVIIMAFTFANLAISKKKVHY